MNGITERSFDLQATALIDIQSTGAGIKRIPDIRNERPLLSKHCVIIAVLHVRSDGTL